MTTHDSTDSPFTFTRAKSRKNVKRSLSPVEDITVKKKRRKHGDTTTGEEEHTARILLPASDTPIIRRNKAIRQSVANNDRKASNSSMRGRRTSSMVGEGIWNAQPHSEVQTSEFYTMIPSDLLEPRRMRLLLGWCGDRALPPKPQAPSSSSKKASEEFQALQAARVIQEELSKELSSNGSLSEWFSRDIEAPQPAVVLRKKPNPRNVANAAKVEELERELKRLEGERQAWNHLVADASAAANAPSDQSASLSPLQLELLSPTQQEILEQFQQKDSTTALDLESLENRLQNVSSGVEFIVDEFSHSVHAVATAKDIARRMADRSLKDTAKAVEQRDQDIASHHTGPKVDALDALRGLARMLNTQS